mmetsp:Transcript_32773/g.52285  ORF Transcript_32773/g.52285 Transcript_32773/m.52285 type:complete len:161 (-) Transcript_32773:92-574(-)
MSSTCGFTPEELNPQEIQMTVAEVDKVNAKLQAENDIMMSTLAALLHISDVVMRDTLQKEREQEELIRELCSHCGPKQHVLAPFMEEQAKESARRKAFHDEFVEVHMKTSEELQQLEANRLQRENEDKGKECTAIGVDNVPSQRSRRRRNRQKQASKQGC